MMGIKDRIGDYRIEGELPQPGAELRFHATHILLPRTAIVHVIAREHGMALMREACILEVLRYPGIPRVYECGVFEDQLAWAAVEHVVGTALPQRTVLAMSAAVAVLRDVATLLDHAHRRGIVHHGVRAESILRCDGSRGYATALVDWSSAKAGSDSARDIAALGRVVYELLAGGPPTIALSVRCATVPDRLGALVDQMMARNPAARPIAAAVAAEAERVAKELEPSFDQTQSGVVEEVRLQCDLSRDPAPRLRRKWTPAFDALATQTDGGSVLAAVRPRR